MDQAQPKPYWETKSLTEMSTEEWEALCDGCGRCCLNKLQDEDNGKIYLTSAACYLLDIDSCRCSDYQNRKQRMSECISLSPDNTGWLEWLPDTCGYRLRARGLPLPDWHPLVSGDPDSVHQAGISVRHLAISELDVDDLRDYVLED